MEKFLNFYSKYPWVSIIIVLQWLTAAYTIIYIKDVDVTKIMGMNFIATILFSYVGFKVPRG